MRQLVLFTRTTKIFSSRSPQEHERLAEIHKKTSHRSSRMATCHPDRLHIARGLCGMCWQRWRKTATFTPKGNVVTVPECHPDKPHYAKGLCNACYTSSLYWRTRETWAKAAKKYRQKPEAKERHRQYDRERWASDPRYRDLKLKYARRWYTSVKGREWCQKNTLRKNEEVAGRPRPERCEACGDIPMLVYKGKVRSSQIIFDHDHKTGKFRGWICQHCNRALGGVKDDVVKLMQLVSYLKNGPSYIEQAPKSSNEFAQEPTLSLNRNQPDERTCV